MHTPSPLQVVNASFELLERILNEAYDRNPEDEVRGSFVYRHSHNILVLGRDVLALELENRSRSSAIVVRTMIESLLKLVAAVKNPAYAAEKFVSELEEDVEKLKKWDTIQPNETDESYVSEAIDSLSELARTLRDQYQITTRDRWNMFSTAREADLNWHYVQDYYMFSQYTHATMKGMMSLEGEIGRGHTFKTMNMIVILAIGHAVQVLETDTPQVHIDKATELLRLLGAFIEGGIFQDDHQ